MPSALPIEMPTVCSEICQQLESVRIREKVLRMNFEPSDGRASGHHLRDVRKPKADTGPFSRLWSGVRSDGHVPLSSCYLGWRLPPTMRSQ
jgi:hypothetical protein